MTGPIRVLVVDDSATARALLSAMLAHDPEIIVVGEADSGESAIEAAHTLRPSLITMDVHMPGIDGLEATRKIMSTAPTPIVIVSSATNSSVNMSFDATAAGALTVVAKPEGPTAPDFAARRREFISLIKAMSEVKVVRRWARVNGTAETPVPFAPRPKNATAQVIAIAASTGGPAVLKSIIRNLPRDFPLPILAVQHIARGFAGGLVTWLEDGSSLKVKIAKNGERLQGGTMYVAPEDCHLGVSRGGFVRLSTASEIGGFRPSATFLFHSVASVYHAHVAALILTGMGRDGVDGLADVSRAGGHVIAQDEESCVVYGMPHEAVRAGVVDTILSASQMPGYLKKIGGRRGE